MDKILENLRYTNTHEWVELFKDSLVRIGISDYAQHALGDLVFINLPVEGDTVTVGQAFGDLESVKAVSEIISPVTGTVTAVNKDVVDRPEIINEDPYKNWFIEVSDITDTAVLKSAAEYKEFCIKEAL